MPDVKFKHVVSCSSEDPKNPAANLVAQEAFRKWKGVAGQSSVSVILQLEKSTKVRALDIGNEFSAFIEVLVGKSTDTEDAYHVLLPAASFMNPNESRSETNGARVRMFASDDLVASTMAQSWDRVKIICQQPFNKQLAFGLAFIRIIEAKSETAQGPNDSKGASATVLQPKNQLTLGRFALRAEPNSDTGSNLSPGAMFMKKQMSKDAPEEDSNSASAIRNAPQPKPSTPSTFMELSSKRKKSPEPKPKAKRQASDVASSSAAKVPRQKSPSRTTPQPRGEGKQKAPPQPSPSPSMPTVPTTPVAPKVAPKAVTKLKRAPFDQLFSGVTFAMSGFVNPLRAQLREKALELGGKYKPDWQPGCTHLICAFANTPKFNQVRGRGKIVKKEWIEDCHSRRRRLPWRRYALDRADQGRAESEDEIEADDGGVANTSSADASLAAVSTEPVNSASESPSPVVQKYTTSRLEQKKDPDFKLDAADGSSTDVDSEASNTDDEIDQIRTGKKSKERPNRREQKKKDDGGRTGASGESPTKGNVDANGLPLLPDFFAGKHFFIFGKMLTADERRQVNRYVTAFGGVLEQYMDHKVVNVVATKNDWDENFDRALAENPAVIFVQPQWIIDCGRQEKLIPVEPFLIEKS